MDKGTEGTFEGMKGELSFMPTAPEQAFFRVCIDASSVNTGSKTRDKHLRKEDFFHVEEYPDICFESTAVSSTQEGFKAKGKLQMHGIEKVMELPFTYKENTFHAYLDIDRFDFNIGKDVKSAMVGQYVRVEIICVVR